MGVRPRRGSSQEKVQYQLNRSDSSKPLWKEQARQNKKDEFTIDSDVIFVVQHIYALSIAKHGQSLARLELSDSMVVWLNDFENDSHGS